jgi:hypothetical protein
VIAEPSVASEGEVHVDVTAASATKVDPEASAMGNVARAIAAAEFTNRVRRDEEPKAGSFERCDTSLLLRPLELTNIQV